MSGPLKYVVWETTRMCDQTCLHCVNASGKRAPGELNREEALTLCQSIIDMGAKEVGLTGGESYLRRDIYDIIAKLSGAGIRVSMQTGGFTLTRKRAKALKDAGLASLGVSVDGPKTEHDFQRGRKGSFDAAMKAIDLALDVGMQMGVNTQLNNLSVPHIDDLFWDFRRRGVMAWQVTLTLPAGRGAQQLDWILQPDVIPQLIEQLAHLQEEAWERPLPHEGKARFNIVPGTNLGYFGPHEQTLRSLYGKEAHWTGPQDGIRGCFVSCEGDIRGSTFLQGDRHKMGNLRARSLQAIWGDPTAGAYTRRRCLDDLWGFCKTCYYKETCLGGDILSTEVLLGKRGNAPHCAHRALTLAKAGKRERLMPKTATDEGQKTGGVFELLLEALPANKSRSL